MERSNQGIGLLTRLTRRLEGWHRLLFAAREASEESNQLLGSIWFV
jgi:hypothetical protein